MVKNKWQTLKKKFNEIGQWIIDNNIPVSNYTNQLPISSQSGNLSKFHLQLHRMSPFMLLLNFIFCKISQMSFVGEVI